MNTVKVRIAKERRLVESFFDIIVVYYTEVWYSYQGSKRIEEKDEYII
jgi:hypothetical protein